MSKVDTRTLYKNVANRLIKYDEEKHCTMLLEAMRNPERSTYSSFCVEAMISENQFYSWVRTHTEFRDCYSYGKMLSRENWEQQGRDIREEVSMPGTQNCKFEYWRMIGWSRFGIGKNSRIKLDLNPKATPAEHYSQLLQQASEGDFTASEIKQLMEAVNVGLNTHQACVLQKEIDQLREDLIVMRANSNGNDIGSDKRIAKDDQDSLANSICL